LNLKFSCKLQVSSGKKSRPHRGFAPGQQVIQAQKKRLPVKAGVSGLELQTSGARCAFSYRLQLMT